MLVNLDKHYLAQRGTLTAYEQEVVDIAMSDLQYTAQLLKVRCADGDIEKSLEAAIIKYILDSREAQNANA